MQIIPDDKFDFKSILLRPKRSTLNSRSEVDLIRTFKFKNSGNSWTGIPIMSANMDTTGTMEMQRELAKHKVMTCLHKHYTVDELAEFFNSPDTDTQYVAYSMGIVEKDFKKWDEFYAKVSEGTVKFVCIDVANGYTERFGDAVAKFHQKHPNITIIAGNVVTCEITEELILRGADIIKVGIGPGSVCTTRIQTGVGMPQLSAIMECADAAHGLGGLICGDGGCTCPGDVAKAFAGGSDFVMLGGMLAGHEECNGKIETSYYTTDEVEVEFNKDGTVKSSKPKIHEKKVMKFYGMSSGTAMDKYSGGVAQYRSSEGRTVEVPFRGRVETTILDILGGVRSTCTYVGASTLKQISKRATFIKVVQQFNSTFSSKLK